MRACRIRHSGAEGERLRRRVYDKVGIDHIRARSGPSLEAWTPERGDRILRWLGLDPFPTDADPSLFDPMSERRWSILMSLAWAMWRTPDAVRKHWAKYIDQCKEWGGLEHGRREYRRRKASHVLALKIAAVRSDDLRLSFDEAESQLIDALAEGLLTATGRPPGQRRRVIPALEWPDMTFASDRERVTEDTFVTDKFMGGRAYEGVEFSREDIVRLFKPIASVAPQPPSMSAADEGRCVKRYAEMLRADQLMTARDARAALKAEGFSISGEAWRHRISKAVRREPGVRPAKRGARSKAPAR